MINVRYAKLMMAKPCAQHRKLRAPRKNTNALDTSKNDRDRKVRSSAEWLGFQHLSRTEVTETPEEVRAWLAANGKQVYP